MNRALNALGELLARTLLAIALLLGVALVVVLGIHGMSEPDRYPPGPPPAAEPAPQAPAVAEMPTPKPQPVQPVEKPVEKVIEKPVERKPQPQQPANDNPVPTKRADKLNTITGQGEPEIEGSPPFRARVSKAIALLRERSPTGYQYILHLSVIREGTASTMNKTAWGPAAAQTIGCGRRNAGAILGPNGEGAARDAAYLAHEGAHVALGLCGPNAHADGRVYSVDLLVRYELEDAEYASYESFSREVIAAEAGR